MYTNFETQGMRRLIRQTTIGSATARLFPAVDLYAELRREQPYRLIDRSYVRPNDR